MKKLNVGFALFYIKHKKLIHFLLVTILLSFIGVVGLYDFKLFIEYIRSPKAQEPGISVYLPYSPEFAEDLDVLWSGFLPANGSYDLVAKIRNSNREEGTNSLQYKFTLLDSRDQVIKEVTGQTYILPEDTRYIIRTDVEADQRTVADVRFEIVSNRWIRKAGILRPDLISLDHLTKLDINEVGRLELFVVLQNNDLYNYKDVEVNAILLGDNDAIVAVNYTVINNFYNRTRREVRFFWPANVKDYVTNVEIEVKTDTYTGSNFITPGNNFEAEPSDYRDI